MDDDKDVIGQGRKLVRKNQILLCLLQSVWSYRLGWYLGPAGRSGAPGVRKPLNVCQNHIHPHLREHLDDDESSFEVAVFKGPAKPLGALLEGSAEPLHAIFWGLAEPLDAILGGSAEPLSVSEEHLADLQGTRVSADTVDFPEEAWVPVDSDPGLPAERMWDSVVLSGRSENTLVNEVWHWTDLDSLSVEAATVWVLPPETTVGNLASTNCLASGKDMRFSTWTCWIPFSFCQTGQSLVDDAWGPLQLEHSLGPSHWPSCLSFPQPVHFAATLQCWLMRPNLLQLKQRIGLGTNKATFTFR